MDSERLIFKRKYRILYFYKSFHMTDTHWIWMEVSSLRTYSTPSHVTKAGSILDQQMK